jgi:hypothetical protein
MREACVSTPILRGMLAELVGKECRRVASEGGGVLSLEFEDDLALFIRCAWRLDAPGEVLAVWSDPSGFERCQGARVRAVELDAPAHDLMVSLGGAVLRVFAERPSDDGLNYCVSSPTTLVTVWSAGRLTSEPAG